MQTDGHALEHADTDILIVIFYTPATGDVILCKKIPAWITPNA